MSPITQADGDDAPGLRDELVPGIAAVIDDVALRAEDAIGQPVVSDELPDVLDRVQLGAFGRQRQQADVGRHQQSIRQVPAGLVDEQDRMGAWRNGGRHLRQVGVVQPRRLAGRLAVDEAIGAVRVELHHPVPHDLRRHPANPRDLRACRSVIDRGHGKQTAGLAGVLAPARHSPQARRVEITPQRDRHGKPPSFATDRIRPAPRRGSTAESRSQGAGIIPTPGDQNWCAQSRKPMEMMRQGWATSLFQASQQ